jgi:hypothetical protein
MKKISFFLTVDAAFLLFFHLLFSNQLNLHNMLKKSFLLFFPFMTGIVALTGCNNLDNSGYTTLTTPGIVSYSPKTVSPTLTPFICSAYGEFAAPDLAAQIANGDLSEGDCIYAQFTVEDNPSAAYATATHIWYDVVTQGNLWGRLDTLEEVYDYPLSGLIKTINISASPIFQGRMFVLTNFNESIKKKINYRLTYDTAEATDELSVVTLYLDAKQTDEDLEKSLDGDVQAFNVNSLFYTPAVKDTTITANSTDIRLKRVNVILKYAGLDRDEQPAYINCPVNPNPFTLYIYQN